MQKKILIPIDFSEVSSVAFTMAEKFIPDSDEVHILHIYNPYRSVIIDPGGFINNQIFLREEFVAGLLQQLDEIRNQKLQTHSNVILHVISSEGDDIGNVLCRFAANKQIDLLIMSSHGRTGLSRLMMGSVAEKVVRSASCPVLIVHPSKDKQKPQIDSVLANAGSPL